MKKSIIVFIGILFLFACSEYKYIDEDTFLGTWELKGRRIYSNMKIRITKENGTLKGYVVSPPDNKYGDIFIQPNDPWIVEIKRGSNYYFQINELKIANELFSLYGIDVHTMFYATFSEQKDKIYLIQKAPNTFIQESNIYYQRIEEN